MRPGWGLEAGLVSLLMLLAILVITRVTCHLLTGCNVTTWELWVLDHEDTGEDTGRDTDESYEKE